MLSFSLLIAQGRKVYSVFTMPYIELIIATALEINISAHIVDVKESKMETVVSVAANSAIIHGNATVPRRIY